MTDKWSSFCKAVQVVETMSFRSSEAVKALGAAMRRSQNPPQPVDTEGGVFDFDEKEYERKLKIRLQEEENRRKEKAINIIAKMKEDINNGQMKTITLDREFMFSYFLHDPEYSDLLKQYRDRFVEFNAQDIIGTMQKEMTSPKHDTEDVLADWMFENHYEENKEFLRRWLTHKWAPLHSSFITPTRKYILDTYLPEWEAIRNNPRQSASTSSSSVEPFLATESSHRFIGDRTPADLGRQD